VSTTGRAATSPTPKDLEKLAVALAQGGAAVVQGGAPDGLAISAKSTTSDLVTQVDRQTERWLVDELAQRRPDDAVLGEEGGGRAGTSGVRWLLDPIDGTVNFVLGIPHYGVSVAAERDGVVVAGAVCNPASGELFHASLDGGAYLDGRRLSGRRDVPLSRAVVATGFGYDDGLRARQVAVLAPMLPRVADVRRLGAASMDLCFLAAGRIDAYFEAGLNHWDYAAAGLVATEAGCVVSGLHGRPPSGRLYAASAPGLADSFFALLEAEGADQVST
jgi:myo-inositol-1(or 4)-monophosphatase